MPTGPIDQFPAPPKQPDDPGPLPRTGSAVIPPQTVVAATGQVASDIVGGLKSQPAMLALMVLNGMFLVLLWFAIQQSSQIRHSEMISVLDRCYPANRITPEGR